MKRVSDEAKFKSSFAGYVENADYPCVGAKAALSRRLIEYYVAEDMESPDDDLAITEKLQQFACRMLPNAMFSTFVAGFVKTRNMSERDFEKALWQRLQTMHDLDQVNYGWDCRVSNDPQSPNFSVSIGGEGFYVIGVHPNASRMARRFDYAALVFNLHSQFEHLRADGRYERMTQIIAERDVAMSGSRNPMLAKHGDSSEARQYSGRQTRPDWICPFHAIEKTPDAT